MGRAAAAMRKAAAAITRATAAIAAHSYTPAAQGLSRGGGPTVTSRLWHSFTTAAHSIATRRGIPCATHDLPPLRAILTDAGPTPCQ